MSEELVTIEQYDRLEEAIVARGMLEALGIKVFLADENLCWMTSRAFGVRLQVRQSDAAEAQRILRAGSAEVS